MLIPASNRPHNEHAPSLEFERLVIDCPAEVQILIDGGMACSVTVTGPIEAAAQIRSDIFDGLLRLECDSETLPASVLVSVTLPFVTDIVHNGPARTAFQLDYARRLNLRAHGAGQLVGSGRVSMLHASLTGAGDMLLQELNAAHGWLIHCGRGNLHARVSRTVRLDPCGTGKFRLNEHLRAAPK